MKTMSVSFNKRLAAASWLLLVTLSVFALRPKWVGNTPVPLNGTYKFVEIVSRGSSLESARLQAKGMLEDDTQLQEGVRVYRKTKENTTIDKVRSQNSRLQERKSQHIEIETVVDGETYSLQAVRIDEWVEGREHGEYVLHLIRYRFLKTLSEEDLKSVIIPYGLIWGDLEKDDDGVYTAKEIRSSAIRHYSILADLFDELELAGEGEMSQSEVASRTLRIEAYMEKKRREETDSLLRVYPFTIGTILSYLSLSGAEDDALKAILSAKYYDWSEDRIRRELNGSVY